MSKFIKVAVIANACEEHNEKVMFFHDLPVDGSGDAEFLMRIGGAAYEMNVTMKSIVAYRMDKIDYREQHPIVGVPAKELRYYEAKDGEEVYVCRPRRMQESFGVFQIIDIAPPGKGNMQIQGCVKIPYRGYEISISSLEYKPEIRAYDEAENSIFTTYDMTGEGLQEVMDAIDAYIKKELGSDRVKQKAINAN